MNRSFAANLRCLWLRTRRDSFLLAMVGMMLGSALGLRFALPAMTEQLLARTGFELTPYLSLIASYFVLCGASVACGILSGFLLVEAQEEGPLLALRVAHQGPTQMLRATMLATFALSVLVSVAMSWCLGATQPPIAAWLSAICLSALASMTFALLLAAGSRDKVQAFAVSKILSLLALFPVLAYFLGEPLQFVAGVLPLFWSCKIWWLAVHGEPWIGYLAPGLGCVSVWILASTWVLRRRWGR